MKEQHDIFNVEKLKKGFWLSVKITLIFATFFFVINGYYSLKSLVITVGVSAMYSFVLGFGQGLLNDYLSTKWDWITQTNQRVWAGILMTVTYTVPAILLINYVLFIKIQGEKFE